MEEWFERYLHLSADELGVVLAFALPLLALLSRRVRLLLGQPAGRVALAAGRPQERYRRWFLAEYGTLRNIYLNRVETLDLADSYISLSVRAESEATGTQVAATTLMARSGPRRIVIVGDPGTGKSTLLRAYGAGVLRRVAGDSELNLVGRTSELPILITLRQVADFLVRGGLLEDHVLAVLEKRTRTRNARAMLRRLLLQGRIVVLLDGLDEVSRLAYEAVRGAIHAFVSAGEHAYLPTSHARVVITCRRQNYRQIEEDWSGWFSTTSYAIAALRDAEIERFVARRAAQFSAERPAGAFLADVRASGTVDLHRVPLILTISVGLYTQLAAYEIPHSIGAFYDEMVRELLRRHDFRAEGQLRMNKYKAEDKHRFLRELALHLAETRPSSFADFSYDDLIGFCAARRGTMPRLRDERDFVDEIIDRSGLLSRTTDDGHFAFAHRALHEHLAAAQLARDPGPGCQFLMDRVADPQWRQVTVLFCGEAHPYVGVFLRHLADRSPELACHCLATAEVSAGVATDLINRARRHSMLSAIMEAVKSPVADTRTFALDALRTELVWIARHADRQERRRIVAELFGGQSPVAGKLLLAMSRHATPAMAAAIVQLTATMPDDEPALVAPLWHCLAIPDVARSWEVAREIVVRLLVLAMDPECAAVLDRLPALQPDWPSAADRAAAYPLKRGLPMESNLVTLLGLGHALRTFDGLPRKNLYLVALTDPGAPLAVMEASASWSKLSLYRMAKVLSYAAFYAALAGNVVVARAGLGDAGLHPRAALTALAASLVACTAVTLALSSLAVRRFWDHVHAAPFSAWCYLVPAVDPNFGLSRVEPLWRLLMTRPGRTKLSAWPGWLGQVGAGLVKHLFLTSLYGLPIALALWRWPWLVPVAVMPALMLFYWLPATELCGRHTTRVFLPSRRFLDIYQDPASRHWVLPHNHGQARTPAIEPRSVSPEGPPPAGRGSGSSRRGAPAVPPPRTGPGRTARG